MKYSLFKYKIFYYLILIIVVFLFNSCSNSEEKTHPIKRDLVESVYSSVIVQPDSLYNVYSVASGILVKNFVEEGDLVIKGEKLIQITNTATKLNSNNAKLAFDLAKENYFGNAAILDGIKDEITAAELKFKNDSVNFYRQQRLWNKKIGSRFEFETRKLNYQLSKSNLNLLQNKFDRTKKELLTSVKQTENSYKSSLVNTNDYTVKSIMKGKVYELTKEPGEIVTNFDPVAVIGSATLFTIKMLVDEVDIVKISKGQQVIISLDAYKGEAFAGKVSKIYPKKDERNQTFKVEAIFKEAPKVLYPGLSGEANIVIGSKKNVLTVPKIYINENNEVKTVNGVLTVKTGLQNLEFIEIISGISENTNIYKPDK
ncbi:efflux RND transporter periplasmic adaptor subunit [Lutibacter citreus]|uniref:efflux RND transporter periplasmic adaptor subunit n=1 Tax=Lutibacter citreus TaxID=2138210 RepID=UPI000DBE6EEC|nr:HlyD family efflux transporter periplasmic adaptor subunit [Lutibacter citreus]